MKLKLLITILITILMILIPLIPDVQVSRPKLLVIELGFLTVLFIALMMAVSTQMFEVKKSLINATCIAILTVYILSFILSKHKYLSLVELRRIILCCVIYFIFSNSLTTHAQRKAVLSGWLIGTSLAALYGILQRYGGFWIIQVPQMHRVMSFFGNPIFFASHLTISIPVFLGFLTMMHSKHLKLLSLIAILIGLYALYLTETRSAWLGVSVAFITFLVLTIRNKLTKIVIICLFILIFGLFGYLKRDVWLRHHAHHLIWFDTVKMWLANPIFGTSIGTFHIYFPEFASEKLRKIWPQKQFIINDAHNEYLQVLSETGIIGFGIFLWFLISIFVTANKLLKTSKQKLFLTGLVSAIAGILFQNIFSVDMRFTISTVYLFITLGILQSYSNETIQLRFNLNKTKIAILYIMLILIFGIVSFSVKANSFNVHLLSVLHLKLPETKISIQPDNVGIGLLQYTLTPYIAHREYLKIPDFFAEKVLEPLKTIQELEELAQKHPNHAIIYEKLAWVYAKERNFAKAIENYEKAISLDPNKPGPYNNLGNIFFQIYNDRPRAIHYYKKSIEVAPRQIDARLNLGTLYYFEGMLKEAAEQFNEVLKIEPDNEKAIVMLKRMRE